MRLRVAIVVVSVAVAVHALIFLALGRVAKGNGPGISEEDHVRLESLRGWQTVREKMGAVSGDADRFLEEIDGQVHLEFAKSPLDPRAIDPRALQLINKTNQFNLNGARYTDAAWKSYLQQAETFLLVVSYQDRYGRLGKIAVLSGRAKGSEVTVDNWVMSCRAFARRIEHRCLEQLFERYRASEIDFNFIPTARNVPTQDFFKEFLGEAPKENFRLTRKLFAKKSPKMFHRVMESESNHSPVA